MNIIDLLNKMGLNINNTSENLWLEIFISFVFAIGVSWLLMLLFNKVIYKIINHIITNSKSKWNNIFVEKKFFYKLSYIIPIIVFDIMILSIDWQYKIIIRRTIDAATMIIIATIISSLLTSINAIYETYNVSKNKPIKGSLQAIRIIIYIITTISIISIIINESPQTLLVSLGAFTAVIMLIFKDSILGFIAGVQLTSNNMIKIGDWIAFPKGNADGEVIDISLHTVTVQNWDKTISSIPAYQLVSETFINWRGMEQSKGRRIKRSVYIDMHSVHYLTEIELDELKKSSLIKPYLENMTEKINSNKTEQYLDEANLTNIGVFRYYLNMWIKNNPNINKNMTNMVRQLQPTPSGIPIEIYCFSSKQQWVEYEGVQSDLFDHIIAIIPIFNLKIYQYSGVIKQENN